MHLIPRVLLRPSIFPLISIWTLISFFGHQAYGQAFESFGSGANQFSIQFVSIGHPGNPPAQIGNPTSAGSVPYAFRMGKFEISRQQIEKANLLGNLGLTLDSMNWVDGNLGMGPRPEMPATGLTWNEAARFVNWLNTSQGFPPAYRFAVQPGQANYNPNANILLWDASLSFVDSRGVNRFRHKDCRYFLPSVDEWFKAAYFDPGTSTYVSYPTGNEAPVSVTSGILPGTAVYGLETNQGPADVNIAGGLSPYRVMGLGGNVWEFEETQFNLSGGYNTLTSDHRGGRAGAWNAGLASLATTGRLNSAPNQKSYRIGLRVASVAGTAVQAEILGSYVFYADSFFADQGEVNAIDPTKQLAKEGDGIELGSNNLINTVQGINGLVFEIQGLAAPESVNPSDFVFQVSPVGVFDAASHPPQDWEAAPSPTRIAVIPGIVDQVRIQWRNHEIANRWLRVSVLSTPSTGLAVSETYYLGHLGGELTGLESDGVFRVQYSDVVAVRQSIGQTVDVAEPTDLDKNGLVQFADLTFVRNQVGATLATFSVP